MRRSLLGLLAVFALASWAVAAPSGVDGWQVNGIGGAGGMYTPTISPYDHNFMLLSCDMSGSYRSLDGGMSWQLIHYMQIRSTLQARPAFTKSLVFWAEEGILKYSADKGLTWTAVPIDGGAPWRGTITSIAVVDMFPITISVGTGDGVWLGSMTADGKASGAWKQLAEGGCGGIATIGPTILAAVSGGGKPARIVRLNMLQAPPTGPEPVETEITLAGDNAVTSFAAAAKGDGPATLFATVDNVGIVKSADGGKAWETVAKWDGQRSVLMPVGQTQVAYAAQERSHEVWRTSDGGRTWQSIFHMTGDQKNVEVAWDQTYLHWDYSISHLGLGIDPADPNVVMMTSEGDFYRSNNGGKSWFQCQNNAVGVLPGDGDFRFKTNGVEVTTLWGYYFDPNDSNRTYIAYTDIGFTRSVDRGQDLDQRGRGAAPGQIRSTRSSSIRSSRGASTRRARAGTTSRTGRTSTPTAARRAASAFPTTTAPRGRFSARGFRCCPARRLRSTQGARRTASLSTRRFTRAGSTSRPTAARHGRRSPTASATRATCTRCASASTRRRGTSTA